MEYVSAIDATEIFLTSPNFMRDISTERCDRIEPQSFIFVEVKKLNPNMGALMQIMNELIHAVFQVVSLTLSFIMPSIRVCRIPSSVGANHMARQVNTEL